MDCINGESAYLKERHVKVEASLVQVSLKDVPREVRRREAKKPLFLIRCE